MKTGIHPEYMECAVRCSCGNQFTTRATKPEMHVELCSQCHPFYTGKQKLVDTGGRVEKFQKRYGAKPVSRKAKAAEAATAEGPETQAVDEPTPAE